MQIYERYKLLSVTMTALTSHSQATRDDRPTDRASAIVSSRATADTIDTSPTASTTHTTQHRDGKPFTDDQPSGTEDRRAEHPRRIRSSSGKNKHGLGNKSESAIK